MCKELCGVDGEYQTCQDCGICICYEFKQRDDVFSPPGVSASGDLFCLQCAVACDEDEEAFWIEESSWEADFDPFSMDEIS